MRVVTLSFVIVGGLAAGCLGIDPGSSTGPQPPEPSTEATTPRALLNNYARAIATGDAELFASCIDVSEEDKQALLDKLGSFLAMMEAGRELTEAGTKKFGPGFAAEGGRESRPWDYAGEIGQSIVKQVEKAVIVEDGELATAFIPGSGPEGTRLARINGLWVLPFASGQALLAGFSEDVELVILIFEVLGELYGEGLRVLEKAKSVSDFNALMRVVARPYLEKVGQITEAQAGSGGAGAEAGTAEKPATEPTAETDHRTERATTREATETPTEGNDES